MDIIDITQDRMEAEEKFRRMQREAAGPNALLELDRSRGKCYNCGDPVIPGTPFCDDDCRDDHQWRKNRGK